MKNSVLVLVSLVAACGGPPPSQNQPPAGQMMGTPEGGSPNALGPCTGEVGSSCANGRGICGSDPFGMSKQCLALRTSGTCPRGSFATEYLPGKTVCLDLCTTARDCAAGYFCNPTSLGSALGQSQRVQVCIPGSVNRAGQSCGTQADCDLGSSDLTCVGATTTSSGICTKSCKASTECQSKTNTTAVCAKDSTGQGFCFQSCTTACAGDAVCRNNVCLPKAATSMTTTFSTPAFGQLGGGCASSSSCEGRYTCLTSRPGGLCTAACQSSRECGAGVCVQQPDGTGVCFAKCESPGTQSTCRSSYQCRPLEGLPFGYCL